jgi:glyoxylase-like metal-dependent hydrolase (beta-lactamase superfamily II)
MTNQNYKFKIGTFDCIAISDGTFTYAPPLFPPPVTFLFANAAKDRVEEKLRTHSIQPERYLEWTSPYTCLLINTGKRYMLIDTGAGDLGPNTGKLLNNLHIEGISSDDIDTVILTHGHPDHIGGNTDSKGKPVFTEARFVMWENEWNFWTSELAELRGNEHSKKLLRAVAHKNLPPIKNQLDLIDSEREILPGIRAISASGHTPGHMALAISSKGEQLLCLSDAVLHPIHVEQPDWHATVDFYPEQTIHTRFKLFQLAFSEKALTACFHFPFPGIGRIIQKEGRWGWQPILMGSQRPV